MCRKTLLRLNHAKSIIFFSCLFASMVANSTVFINEGDWQAAAGDYKLETFESLGGLGSEINALFSIGVDFATTNNIYDGSSNGPLFGNYSLINTYPYNTSQLYPFSITSSNGELITAVGLWNASADDDLYLTFFDANDAVIESIIIPGSFSVPIFGGIVNNQGAARVESGGTGNANRWVAIDNLQVSLAQSVSEPSVVLLLGSGLIGLFGLKKRRT